MKACHSLIFSWILALAPLTGAWAVDAAPVKIKHPPYTTGLCQTCHKMGPNGKPQGDAFVASQPDLCYSCHDRKDAGSDVHPALGMVDCTFCHEAHESQNPTLLKDKIGNICVQCHDAPGQDSMNKHSALVMVKSCVRCHSPHSSDNDKLLLADTPTLCTYCHTDIGAGIANTANTVHPAIFMGCQNCHAPHGSDNEKLLKQTPNDLCFTCHDKGRFADGHPKRGHPISGRPDPIYPNKDLTCISCHKPHFSPNEHMLRYNFKSPPYDGTICSVCHWAQLSPKQPPQPPWN